LAGDVNFRLPNGASTLSDNVREMAAAWWGGMLCQHIEIKSPRWSVPENQVGFFVYIVVVADCMVAVTVCI